MGYITGVFTVFIQELAQKGSVRFYVRVRPDASTTKATSVMDDQSVKINVAAPATEGKANAALVAYLAKQFNVPKTNVHIVSGQTSRHKLIKIEH